VFASFFIAAYGVFGVGLGNPTGPGVWGFYLFGDLFSTLMVATFFSFLNDSVSSGAAHRLYGLMGFLGGGRRRGVRLQRRCGADQLPLLGGLARGQCSDRFIDHRGCLGGFPLPFQ
jgi:hypothetical protein